MARPNIPSSLRRLCVTFSAALRRPCGASARGLRGRCTIIAEAKLIVFTHVPAWCLRCASVGHRVPRCWCGIIEKPFERLFSSLLRLAPVQKHRCRSTSSADARLGLMGRTHCASRTFVPEMLPRRPRIEGSQPIGGVAQKTCTHVGVTPWRSSSRVSNDVGSLLVPLTHHC